ncbi:MAG: hypothetical protein IJE70_06740 [Oscillospiraceae bacterium]|nr:hypothetical protein [Oscillospiraceae bacterium]
MFIDINTYVGHWPFRNLKYNTLEGLDKLAREYGVTHMVVANLNGFFYKDANTANLELLKELESYNGETEFLPLAIVNPAYPEWEKDARDMIAKGFAGFELAPLYHGYSLAPEMLYDEYSPKHRALEVLNLAEELDVPVRICAGFENFRGRSPFDTYENIKGDDYFALLSKNKNVHVFVTSFAPSAVSDRFAELLKDRENTYLDLTQISPIESKKALAKTLENVTNKKLCFGSLSPFCYMAAELIKMEFVPELDTEAMKTNAARAFKKLR